MILEILYITTEDQIVKKLSKLMGSIHMRTNDNHKSDNNLCILSFPFASPTGKIFLSNFLDIVTELFENVYVTSADLDYRKDKNVIFYNLTTKLHYKEQINNLFLSVTLWAIKFIAVQFEMSYNLYRIINKTNYIVFFLGSYYQIPLIIAKLYGKKTITITMGSSAASAKSSYPLPISKCIEFLDNIMLNQVDYIIPESKALVNTLNLDKYGEKILPSGARYIDINSFYKKVELHKRGNTIGYVGRFSRDKGIVEFMDSLYQVFKLDKTIKVIIIGSGTLHDYVKKKADEYKDYNIELVEWISHDELAIYLNKLKLLVLPSYTEGLPTIILESMACGTPVLATDVGAITDIIIDNETGFILQSNSPECIAKSIGVTLNKKNLDVVTENAYNLVLENYTLDAAINRYKNIFSIIKSGVDT